MNGYRITQRRLAMGYSQEELGALIGTSQKMVSRWENGAEPGALKLKALAEALDTSTDYLLGLTDSPERPLRSSSDLSEDERDILRALRANRQHKQIVLNLLKSLAASVG